MNKVTRWKIDKKTELKFRWDRGAAFDLSSEGFDGPDMDRFEAFSTTFLWACCQNRGKATPKQLVLLIFKNVTPEEEEELQKQMLQTLIEVMKHSPWVAIAEALEDHFEGSEDSEGVVIGGEDEPGKLPSPSIEETSSASGPDSEPIAE